MVSIPEKLYTIEELWELVSDEKYQFAELHYGELIVAGGSGAVSSILAGFLLHKISIFVHENKLGYVTGADGHYVFSEDPSVAVIPDVAFVSTDRMPRPVPNKFLHIIPNIAIEVISPSERAKDIRQKIEIYLEYGTDLIWTIYPSLKRIDIHRQTNKSQTETLGVDDILSGESVLNGFTLSVKDIFSVVE
ncbi:MAG: Uma2 family endonuclease [Phototrophicaceae bacterium]